jgi:hypothetical protein
MPTESLPRAKAGVGIHVFVSRAAQDADGRVIRVASVDHTASNPASQ